MMNSWIVYVGFGVIAVVLFLAERYHGVDAEILRAAAELIPDAERLFADREKSGSLKMEWVLRTLEEMIPGLIGLFFPEEKLRSSVQMIYDRMASFGSMVK